MLVTNICCVVAWITLIFGPSSPTSSLSRHSHKRHPRPCQLTTFGLSFPNQTDHPAFAYKKVSRFTRNLYFCAWLNLTKRRGTLLDVENESGIVLQIEVDMTKEPPKFYVTWQNKTVGMDANGLKPNAWTHVCFEATKNQMCQLYVNNQPTDSMHCEFFPGWLKGTAILGQKADPVTGLFVAGASYAGVIAGLHLSEMEAQMALENTRLACEFKHCEKYHRMYPGDKSDLLYWPVSQWKKRGVTLKQVQLPCQYHNTKFIVPKPSIVDEENLLIDLEREEKLKQLLKLKELILKRKFRKIRT